MDFMSFFLWSMGVRQHKAPNGFKLRNPQTCLSGCAEGLTVWVLDDVVQPIASHKCKMIIWVLDDVVQPIASHKYKMIPVVPHEAVPEVSKK